MRSFLLAIAGLLFLEGTAHAASFVIEEGQEVTTPQTLNNNETGLIQAGGSLSTSATAINVLGLGAMVTNHGTINTNGLTAYGIYAANANSNITNSGAITTSGFDAEAIFSDGINAHILNSGNIITTGDIATGILSNSVHANVINTGTIKVLGSSAAGVFLARESSSFTNTGKVITTGTSSPGVIFGGAAGTTTTIFNQGSIQVTGKNSISVFSVSGVGNAIINNSGLIAATGNATQAITAGGGDITLNLLPGSRIIGSIDFGTGNNTTNITGGRASSATLTFANADTINLLGSAPSARSGNVVSLVDPTGQSVTGAVLNTTTTTIHNIISHQLSQNILFEPAQVAANELQPGMLGQSDQPQTWGQLFNTNWSRGSDGSVLAYDHDLYGMVGGYEITTDNVRTGVLGGYAKAKIETDIDSIKIKADTFFVGAYRQYDIQNWGFSAELLSGYEDNDSQRLVLDNLNGLQGANADYDSLFISPAITLRSFYELQRGIELRPSAMLGYTWATYEGYKESGTTQSNMHVDSRTVEAWATRLQLAIAYFLNDISELEIRAGATARNTNSARTHVKLLGSAFSYASASDDSVLGGYVGANLRYQIKNKLDLTIDAEYASLSGNEKASSAQVGLVYSF